MEPKKKRKIKLIPFVIVCSFLVLILGTGALLANQFFFKDVSLLPSTKDEPELESDLSGRMNFLLMGIDARDGETKTRTDSIILVSVDKEHNRIAMMSMPRDTRVKIPGHGYDKINSANVYGGPELVMDVVSDLVGMNIDKYVMTNVRGFRDIVDTLGGVTLDVEKKMYHYDPYDEPELREINLKPGVQRLDGNKALQYVRFRSDALGDVSRTERQQKFLKVLAKEMMQPSTITKLPKLVPTINKYIDTNLGLGQMVTLANAAKDLNNVEIVTQTLPGKFLDMNGVSYWSVDSQQAQMVAEALIKDGKVYDVVLGQETVNTQNVASEKNVQSTEKESLQEKTTDKTTDKTNKEANVTKNNNSLNQKTEQTSQMPKGSGVEVTVKPSSGSDEEEMKNGAKVEVKGSANNSNNTQQSSPTTDSSWLPTQSL